MSENSLLKIGEFAQISQVSVKTLRYYDDLGLLRPAHIDPVTNYRYYSVAQLPHVHRIMALKELGLSLEQIGILLADDLSINEIRGMLRLKQAEIRQQMHEAERQLALVEFRLRMLEAEVNFPEMDVVIKPLPALRALSLFVQPHHTQKGVVQALKQAIREGVIQHTGEVIDVLHGDMILSFESPELEDNQHEILIGVRASQDAVTLEEVGTFTLLDLPAIKTAASLILTGADRLANIEQVALLQRWALAHGYQPGGIVRYFHHRGFFHTSNRDEFIIEAQLIVDQVRQED